MCCLVLVKMAAGTRGAGEQDCPCVLYQTVGRLGHAVHAEQPRFVGIWNS